MDPDATLQMFLDACRAYHHCSGGQSQTGIAARADALEALVNLATWIQGGGFLPLDIRPTVANIAPVDD